MRKLLAWLFPLCALVVALSVAFKVFAGPMEQLMFPWVMEWFHNGKALVGSPEIAFRTKDACTEYATEHVAMAEALGLTVTFTCRRGPFIEA